MPVRTYLYVGCCNRPTPYFASANGRGIAAFVFDEASGAAEPLGVTEGIDNPTFLSVDGDGRALHANSEVFGWDEGTVSAYAVDLASGALAYLEKQPSRGSITAHHSRDRTGRFLLVANYGMGPVEGRPNRSLAILPIRAGGGLAPAVAEATHHGQGPDAGRQERPHAHCVLATPDNRFLAVADLGIDQLVLYRFDAATGAIEPAGALDLPPGCGPRHFVFDAAGRFAYLVNELGSSVASLRFDAAAGAFSLLGLELTVPAAAAGSNHCSQIRLSPAGRFLYVANRGHDSLSILRIDADGRAVLQGTVPSGGRTPRHFAFDPSGRFLAVANQDSDRISLFAVDAATGALVPTGRDIATGTPTCIAFCRIET